RSDGRVHPGWVVGAGVRAARHEAGRAVTLFRAGLALLTVSAFMTGWLFAWKCAGWRHQGDVFTGTMQGYAAGLRDGLIRGRSEGRHAQALECASRNHPSHPPVARRFEELPEGAVN